ncbi:undecaprenyldiphospho-muramoylpentapeptide beta-N-acetylglucosaminyltransferase [Motilibacter deserti]|uniref:UDP-N-acetylglucosamine--N-acetylmuramyl-(pentapeptide) pyrophosphoryl-undecaprenol N-acetylglucosamine transferase n=1 Tax=Motilibacter deserti TaxID=2714956 RepID=A0ABX0GN94_9ACTN|nr:undecaprenyldiphospho-muramoylpentapeptide beta-N-acetylglucosaminyltransferase [Motilibacter deserti]NHC12297.1 undecaprenyldiphospho-muramoylpentapeptide beta-N-acetylglucosaminyltransferase [Motilibacter deserti]
MHVVLAGGGTAGHVEPALALADALRRARPDIGVTALGTERGLETRLVPQRGYDLALIPPVPVPRRPSPALLKVPARLVGAVRAAAAVLRRTEADVLVGFGGYVAAPAYLAARRLGVPVVVHEANARPGLANRLGARLTHHVAGAWPDTPLRHADYVGMPLRRTITTLDRAGVRAAARAELGLAPDLPTLLVFGGSQGARRLNLAVHGGADALAAAGVQVLHAAGRGNVVPVERTSGPPYVALEYLDRMDLAYAAADVALCRAGAMTCAELAAVGLPAAYVPLPHGNGEQRLNAEPVVRAGGGLLVDDADCTPEWVASTLAPLLADAPRLEAMGRAAAEFGRRDGDDRLAALVLGVAEGERR